MKDGNSLHYPTTHSRARRKSQSLRIDDAAALLGVSVDLMSRLENGQGSVRLDKAMALLVLPKEHPWVRETEHGAQESLKQ